MSAPNKSISISIANNDYTVSFPKTGQLMDIELLKIQISDGKYETLKYSFTPSFIQQALRIDAIATFSTVIPQLKKDLNVKTMLDLEYEQIEVIVKAYVEQFLPWYEEWMAVLNKTEDKKEDEKQS